MNGLLKRIIRFQSIQFIILVSAAASFAQEKTDERLKLETTTNPNKSIVEIEGLVTEQKKYSIVVSSADETYDIKITKDTKIELKCVSPLVSLEKNKLRIARTGGAKQFKEYAIETPLYLIANFDHQNQFNRTMAAEPKRINQFTISTDKKSLSEKRTELFLLGEVLPGDSGRQLKLKTEKETFQILLGKRGSWQGFSQLDLVAEETSVRIQGLVDDQNTVEARRIQFWPISSAANGKADDPSKS